jgi:hypothetical protein
MAPVLHSSPPLASPVPTHESERHAHVQTLPAASRPYGGATPSARVAYEEWQRHVDAWRIGKGPSTTPAQLLRHMRNEEVLLGCAVSVKVHVREELRGRS